MTTQHTPGPWNVDTQGNLYGTDGLVHPFIGQIDDDHNDVQTIANRRLIASAPELLAALQSLFEHCSMTHSRWGDGCNRKEADAAIASAKAAIAKAVRPTQQP